MSRGVLRLALSVDLEMADSWRRSTMQPAADPYGNVRSGIPQQMPTTAKKPLMNNRMSLNGSAVRSLYQTPGPNQKQSMMRSQNLNPLQQSTSKSGYARTPLNNARRGSLWGGGAPLAPPMSIQILKDSRPLRDRAYQSRMRQEINNYLQTAGFDIPQVNLVNIQAEKYRTVFNCLLLTLDPSYPLNPNVRFEDEFVPALKAQRYPFAHQIDNKWLAAPASMHSWPHLLGVLHWLVELCKLRDEYLSSGDPTIQDPSTVPDEFDDPWDHRALAFEYYDQAYTVWLDLIDVFTEPNQFLEERYARKDERVQADLQEQTNQLSQAKSELEKLKSSAAPVDKLQNENNMLKADSEKFQKILQQYEGRKKKLRDTIAYEKVELANGVNRLEQLRQEQERLANIVKDQNLTPEEVVKMNTDHEMLSRNLEDLKQKIAETHKIVMTLEVSVTHRAEAAEEAVDTYTNLLSSLGLFSPLPAPFENFDLMVELNTAVSNPELILSGADIRKVIKPTLNTIAEAKRSERANLESERIKVDNELDQLTLECENVDEEIGEVEKKIMTLSEQTDDLRDASQHEAAIANAEATRLERDLAQARSAALNNGMGVKSRLQTLQLDYREQIEKVSRLKEETVRAVIKNSHDIAMFKEEVSRHLKELREFAESG